MYSEYHYKTFNDYLHSHEDITKANHLAKSFGSFTDFESIRISKVYSSFNEYLEVNIELLNLELKQMFIDDEKIKLTGFKDDLETIYFNKPESFHSIGHVV